MNEINKHIRSLKVGCEESFLYFYELFEKPLYNHLLRMLGSTSLAEELFQEVMVSMIEKIDTYSHREDLQNSFKAWIFRIATNLAIDEIRRSKKSSILQEDESLRSHVDEQAMIENKDTKERIHYHIQTLPVIQRTFLNLKINEQMTLKEIAVICKCEVNAVKQGLFRARKSMKSLLVEEGINL